MQGSAWGAKVWGGGAGSSSERARLPKGTEPCHICAEDLTVEIKLQPCGHEICLDCCNTMRHNVVFKADAGLKCPFCREFVDGFTDMKGNPNSISDLVEANRAAHKSRVARKTGAERAVSTSVPDPQRLVPSVAPRATSASSPAESTWTCSHCRHINTGSRAECTRCRSPNPAQARINACKDPLLCSEEELVRAACERHHPGLQKAFTEAGTPWANGSIGGTSESVRRALRAKGHERVMRVIHVLTAEGNLERVGLDMCGNYSLQSLLEVAHKLRVEALELTKQGATPAESFASLPEGSPCTAMRAFSQMLKVLIPAMHRLATSERGVFVLLKLVKLASPPEVVYIAEQMTPQMMDWVSTKDGPMFICLVVDRLATIAGEGSSASAKAADALAAMCAAFCQHNRALMQCAKHQHLSPAIVEIVQGALLHTDAFKMGYQLALNAGYLTQARSGSSTLELLTQLKAADLHSREMIRDLCCYMAKSLQGNFGQLALRNEQGGQRVLRGMVGLLLAEREDDWVLHITRELVGAAGRLRGDREALALLCHCLGLPLWTPPELQQYWGALAATGLDDDALRQQVKTAKAGQAPLPVPVHRAVSEVQPDSPPEALKRFPYYVREGATQHQRHSMLKRTQQQQQQAMAAAAAGAVVVPPPPPPPPPHQQQQQQQKAAPPGFAAAAPAAAAAGGKAVPPGFAAGPAAAAAPAANGVTFPDGSKVPMPQPYSSGSSSSAAGSRSSSAQGIASPSVPTAAGVPVGQQQASNASSVPASPAPSLLPLPAAAASMPAAASSAPPARPQQQEQQQAAAAPAAAAPQGSLQLPQPALPSSSIAAQPFMPRQQQQQPAQSLLPPAPRPAAPLAPLQQQQQQRPMLPPHLQALPPHLQHQAAAAQQQPPAAALMHLPGVGQQQQQPYQQQHVSFAGNGIGGGGAMPGPPTPVMPQQPAGAYMPPPQQQQQRAPPPQPAQQRAPPPQPAQLLPHMFGIAAPPHGSMPPQQQQQYGAPPPPQQLLPQQQYGAAAPPPLARQESSGGGSGGSGGGVFGEFRTLNEMLSELTGTAAAAQQPAAPLARPAYRPAYRPPSAALAPVSVAYNPAAAPFLPGTAAAAAAPRPPPLQAASPAARFPMPPALAASVPQPPLPPPRQTPQHAAAAGPPAPPPAAAAAAVAGGSWSCKVCSYHHDGAESHFLCCAMCGTPQS